MKKVLNLGITLFMLAAAVFFWVLAGTQFMQVLKGPASLEDGQAFGQAEGKYISYEAAYPMASRVEEYYSGDQDRVRTMGYVAYDVERQAFLYIIINENDDARLNNLLYYLSRNTEIRADSDMTPAYVAGTLEPMGDEAVRDAVAALEDSDIVGNYKSYAQSEEARALYFGDAYGKVTEAAAREISQGWEQAEWYYVRNNTIDGMAVSGVWFSAVMAVLSLLIFLFRLISLLKGGRVQAEKESSGGKWGQFLDAQKDWVREWCAHTRSRTDMQALLTILGLAAGLAVIGVLVKVPAQTVLTWYLPLGTVLGEAVAILLWLCQAGRSKPGKVMKKLAKGIEKEFPSPDAREFYAGDFLEAGEEWAFQESGKDVMVRGIVGSRFWTALSGDGSVTVVDAGRLKRVASVTLSGSVRSGKVRVSYLSYGVRFYYQSQGEKKREVPDRYLMFHSQDAAGFFMLLVRKRVGDSIEITAE